MKKIVLPIIAIASVVGFAHADSHITIGQNLSNNNSPSYGSYSNEDHGGNKGGKTQCVPEPASIGAIGAGLLGLVSRRRRK